MKLFTKEPKDPIEDRITDAVYDALNDNKTVIRVSLDYEEYKEFKSFVRTTYGVELYLGNMKYRFMGVDIGPTADARRQLEEDDKELFCPPEAKEHPTTIDGAGRLLLLGSEFNLNNLPWGIYSGRLPDGLRYRFVKCKPGQIYFFDGIHALPSLPADTLVTGIAFYPDEHRNHKGCSFKPY